MSSTLSDAMVLAMTPDEQCVGVRIFPKGYRQNGFTYKQFLANGTTAAAKLQTAIERGEIETSGDVAPHPSIIPSPPIRCSDVAVLMESKRDCMSLPQTRLLLSSATTVDLGFFLSFFFRPLIIDRQEICPTHGHGKYGDLPGLSAAASHPAGPLAAGHVPDCVGRNE